MNRRYQVKWTKNGKTNYGICYEKPDANGNVVVADAILPVSYRVRESDLVDIDTDYGRFDMATHEWVDQDEYQTYVAQQSKAADALSDSLPDGVQVGSLFSIGVGDGSAYYVVTKVNKKTCRVEWRGFCPDRYTAPILGWGGTVQISQIEGYVRRAKAKLFSPKLHALRVEAAAK